LISGKHKNYYPIRLIHPNGLVDFPWYTSLMVTIITGDQGSGKTTWLLKQINSLKKSGNCGGILTPAVFKPSSSGKTDSIPVKTGFDALDISTGKRWPLGRTDGSLEGPVFGPFQFSTAGFERAIDSVTFALTRPDDFIVLDEIGPLELHKHKGFFRLLPLLSNIPSTVTFLLVIRKSLIETAVAAIFPKTAYRVIEITHGNRNSTNLP